MRQEAEKVIYFLEIILICLRHLMSIELETDLVISLTHANSPLPSDLLASRASFEEIVLLPPAREIMRC